MQILIARHAGFCSGVRRAVRAAREAKARGKVVATLGPLVHNEAVISRLSQEGINIVDTPDQLQEGILIIRSHGVAPAVMAAAAGGNREVVDATCPLVKRAQQMAEKFSREGFQVAIVGDPDHPEVKGILGWSQGKGKVISAPKDLDKLDPGQPVAVVSQTTAAVETFAEITAQVKTKWPGAKIADTICSTTRERQQEAAEIAAASDLVLVVGGKQSSNTRKLAQVASRHAPTKIVAGAGDISPDWCIGLKTVGILAGASTADWTIREVVTKMDELEKSQEEEQQELTPEQEQTDQVQEAPEAGAAQAAEAGAGAEGGEESHPMEQDPLVNDLGQPKVNDVVTGKVIQVNEDEVLVDIGAKTEAILPKNQVYLEEGQGLGDLFSPGEDIEVLVIKESTAEGNPIVSTKRLGKEQRWEELQEALEQEKTLSGKVKEVVPAGLIFDLGFGFRGFMPGSLFDIRFVPDFTPYIGQELEFKVIELNKSKNKIILSRKKAIEEQELQNKQDTMDKLKPGQVITGTVKRLTGFGAFVDVGGIDGLVHVSEISWGRTDKPSDVLSVGQEVEVRVLDVDKERERISLSIRRVKDDPWSNVAEKYQPGQAVTGTVTRLVGFGAFVQLEPGVEGLVHVSEIADYHVNQPSDVLTEGEEVQVKILGVNPDEQRISLSMREARPGRRERKGNPARNVPAPKEEGNSGVTLGDVFGDLFEDKDYK